MNFNHYHFSRRIKSLIPLIIFLCLNKKSEAQQCNNWLYVPANPGAVTVGDLDVSGNQLTVEAQFNRTAPLNNGLYYGHLVSKHTGAPNVNYALLPNGCEITTSVSGYTSTFQTCPPQLNRFYHVAMVYDGSTLKFYRDGFLLSQQPCTGNMVTNDLATTIAQVSSSGNPFDNQFIGYVNEVRIWNVARTQSELLTYMNAPLPNPTTQTGLLGYYSFNNLLNKQGNAAYNGATLGSAIVNQTNPNCSLVIDSCNLIQPVIPTCTYWPVFASGYSAPISFSNNVSFSFSNPAHLGPNSAYSTMIPGNWFTPDPRIGASSPPNSTAHNPASIGAISILPMTVNDQGTISFSSPTTTGFFLHVYQTVSTLEFDHSFALVSSDGDLHTGSSGSLTNNVLIPDVGPSQSPDDANATIYFPPGISQIKFTVTSAPPIISDGIKLAFTFPDNCITDTAIINDYTPALSLDPCKNIINVEDAAAFRAGDTVLLIQMKGAVIDSSNTSAFGSITNYKNAGNYEFNYIKSITGNSVELLNTITKKYDLPFGKVQLIRVPYYQNARFTSTLTCLPWDGSKGGVLVFNVQDTLELLKDINVTGKGFKGGEGYNSGQLVTNCFTNNYYYPASSINIAAKKGESITTVSDNIIYGKGTLAGGGGGGLDHNSGGGGGGNGGTGGFGGYQLEPCGNAPFDNRGIGGRSLQYSNAANKIFMGSGGGSGHANNPANINFPPGGGNGGGIVIISAQKLKTNSYKIIANGATPPVCPFATTNDCHDAMGGGGAGGTVLLNINNYINNNNVEVAGGNGGNMTGGPVATAGRIGPGGGGGGGVAWLKSAALPAGISVNGTGGIAGVLTTDANNQWGTTPGSNGINLFNLQLSIDNILFKYNIDSVRIKDSITSCDAFDFKGLGYVNTNPVSSWQWYFGDGATAATQNTNHVYAPGNYIPKLVITDINGCKDSITANVTITLVTANAGPDSTICSGQAFLMQSSSIGATQFQWTPASYLNNSSLLHPIATPPPGTTNFQFTATGTNGCTEKDTVAITVKTTSLFSVNTAPPLCQNDFVQLLASGGDTYSWQPATGINATIPNPVVSPQTTTTYTVLITDTVCNFSKSLSTIVTVIPPPTIRATKTNDIDCSTGSAQLSASGGVQYSWSPATTLNNASSSSPIANPSTTTQYFVTATDQFGCINTDSVTVSVDFSQKGYYLMASAFTPNNDGLNDCFGIKYWGDILELEFNIYNRWGERVFHTTKPGDCWNGKYKGVEQKTDVYVYWIRAKTNCEPLIFRKGTVTLIK